MEGQQANAWEDMLEGKTAVQYGINTARVEGSIPRRKVLTLS